MHTEIRKKFLDFDARRDPKTERYCACCQRDINVETPVRWAYLEVESMSLIHSEDISIYEGRAEWVILGKVCAKKLGYDWSAYKI